MADTKITGLGSATAADVADSDVRPLVDVSDTSMDASGTNKKITYAEDAKAVLERVPQYTTTTPSAPSSGVKLFSRSRGGRRHLSFIGPNGAAHDLQTSLARKSFVIWQPQWAATSGSIFGSSAPTTTGTAAAAFWSNADLRQSSKRLQFNTVTTAGNSAGFRTTAEGWYRGDASNRGGFLFIARVGFNSITATRRWFVGMSATTGAFSNADPSTFVSLAGVGQDVGDTTQIQFMHNDSSGSCTKQSTALGDIGTTSVYEITVYSPPNGSSIFMACEDIAAGTVAEYEATTNLPASNQFLVWQFWANNGTTAASMQWDIHGFYLEQDT